MVRQHILTVLLTVPRKNDSGKMTVGNKECQTKYDGYEGLMSDSPHPPEEASDYLSGLDAGQEGDAQTIGYKCYEDFLNSFF